MIKGIWDSRDFEISSKQLVIRKILGIGPGGGLSEPWELGNLNILMRTLLGGLKDHFNRPRDLQGLQNDTS